MGNEYCCEDKSKGGQFHQGKKPTLVDPRLNITQKVNDSGKLTKSQLDKLQQELVQKPSVEKLNQNHSKSPIQKGSNSASLQSSLNASFPKKKDHSEQFDFLKSDLVNEIVQEGLKVPELLPEVASTLKKEEFFSSVQPKARTIKNYGGEIYEGDTSEDHPQGFGKFYKKDGSLFIGYFQNGKANGKGAYIFPNGAFYEGEFRENIAETSNGRYKSEEFEYNGAFSRNLFHGEGKEASFTHNFTGQYIKGFKAYGRFQWTQGLDTYCYEGPFSEGGEFHGKGRLTEPTGVYEGDFQDGFKHGAGVYSFKNGIVYEGNYNFNKREGMGRLINPGNRIAYEGNFSDGLPHGEGIIVDKEGLRHTSKWIMGIDSQLIQS